MSQNFAYKLTRTAYMLVFVVLVLLAALPAFTQTWDLAADWSGSENPNGAWSYRDHFFPANELRNLAFHVSGYNGDSSLDAWQSADGYTSPVVLKNTGTTDYVGGGMVVPAGKVILEPESMEWADPYGWIWPALVRWTAPADGDYIINATFTGRSPDTSQLSVSIVKNYSWPTGQPPTTFSEDSINSYLGAVNRTGTVPMRAGETLEFIVHHLGNPPPAIPPTYPRTHYYPANACQLDLTISRVTGPGWDVARDWSSTSNPSNQWGYKNCLFGTFADMSYHATNYNGSPLDVWQHAQGYDLPIIFRNMSFVDYEGRDTNWNPTMLIPAGKVGMQPGGPGWAPTWTWPSVISWTAPQDGDYQLDATFTGRSPLGNNLKNEITVGYMPGGVVNYKLMDGLITAYEGSLSYSETVPLRKNEIVQFWAWHKDNVWQANNACQFDASFIRITPEGWDLARDWSSTANPSGQWKYGAHFWLANRRELLDFHVPTYGGYNVNLDAWQTDDGYTTPVVLKNMSVSDYTGVGMFAPSGKVIAQANTLSWAPWVWPAVVTWTAPATGNYTYNVTFTGRGTNGNSLWTSVYKDYNWPIGQPDYEISKDTILANGQSFTHTGTLTLAAGQTIDLVIHNKDNAVSPDGNWCQIDATVVPAAFEGTLGDLRGEPDGTKVSLTGKTVTGVFFHGGEKFFYIEETDRSTGIKVVSSTDVGIGNLVEVDGTLETKNGEKQITATNVLPSPGNELKALGMTNKSVLTGTGTETAQGLLVKVWGVANDWGFDGATVYCYLDDGTGFDDGTTKNQSGDPIKGLRVMGNLSYPTTGLHYQAAGCVGRYLHPSGVVIPVIWANSLDQNDAN